MEESSERITATVSYVTCDCGYRSYYFHDDKVKGLSGLKKMLLQRKVTKDAKRLGFKILNQLPDECPGCKTKIDQVENRNEVIEGI